MSRVQFFREGGVSTKPGLAYGGAFLQSDYGDFIGAALFDKGFSLISVANRDAPTTVDVYRPLGGYGWSAQPEPGSNFFHVAFYNEGYHIVEIVPGPIRLQLKGSYVPGAVFQGIFGVALDLGRSLAFLAGEEGMRTVNIADRANPIPISLFPISTGANEVVMSNLIAYLAAKASGAVTVNTVNAAAPVAAGPVVPTAGDASGLDIDGTMLTVAASGAGYKTYDMTDLSAPVAKGIFPSPGAKTVRIVGRIALGCDVYNGVIAIDVTDYTKTPLPQVGGVKLAGYCNGLAVNGIELFIFADKQGLEIYTTPRIVPKTAVIISNVGFADSLVKVGNDLVVRARDSIQRMDMTTPSNPLPVASNPLPYSAAITDTAADNDYVYTVGDKTRVFTNDRSQRLVVEFPLPGSGVAAAWGQVYIAGNGVITITNVSALLAATNTTVFPSLTANVTQPWKLKVDATNKWLYASDQGSSSLVGYDASKAGQPVCVWKYSTTTGVFNFDVDSTRGLIGLSAGSGGIHFVAQATGTLLGSGSTNGAAYDVALMGNFAAAINIGTARVTFFDTLKLGKISVAAVLDVTGGLQRIALFGNYLIISNSDNGWFGLKSIFPAEEPVLSINRLRISPQQTVAVTQEDIAVVFDPNCDPASQVLRAIISNGFYQKSTEPGVALTLIPYSLIPLNQQNLIEFIKNSVAYLQAKSTSNITAFSSKLFINDGSGEVPLDGTPWPTSVTFPTSQLVFQMTPISVPQGAKVPVQPSQLQVLSEGVVDPDIIVYFSDVVAGRYESSDSPGVPITEMIQNDIQAGKLYIVHDGSEIPFSSDVYAEIGSLTSGALQPAAINYIDIQGPPVAVVSPQIDELVEDVPHQLTSANVQYTKPVNPAKPGGPLSITFGSINTANCRFTKDGTALASTTSSFSFPQTDLSNVGVTNVGKQVCTFTVEASYVNIYNQTEVSTPVAMTVNTYTTVHKAPTATAVFLCPTDSNQIVTESQFALVGDGTNPTSGMGVRYLGSDFDLYNAGVNLFNQTFLYELVRLGIIQYSCSSNPHAHFTITDAELTTNLTVDFNMLPPGEGSSSQSLSNFSTWLVPLVGFAVFTIGGGGLWWQFKKRFDTRLAAVLDDRERRLTAEDELSGFYKFITRPTIEFFFDNIGIGCNCCSDSTPAFVTAIENILLGLDKYIEDSQRDGSPLKNRGAIRLKVLVQNKNNAASARETINTLIKQTTAQIKHTFNLRDECCSPRGCCCGNLDIAQLENIDNIETIVKLIFDHTFPNMQAGLVSWRLDRKVEAAEMTDLNRQLSSSNDAAGVVTRGEFDKVIRILKGHSLWHDDDKNLDAKDAPAATTTAERDSDRKTNHGGYNPRLQASTPATAAANNVLTIESSDGAGPYRLLLS